MHLLIEKISHKTMEKQEEKAVKEPEPEPVKSKNEAVPITNGHSEQDNVDGTEPLSVKVKHHTFDYSVQDGHVRIIDRIIDYPPFKSGDTISVFYKIIEGNKERVQQFQGNVVQRKGSGSNQTCTVRKISGGIGVERIFPLTSPYIQKIEVLKKGKIRRARLYYLRKRKGKSARIIEKRDATNEN